MPVYKTCVVGERSTTYDLSSCPLTTLCLRINYVSSRLRCVVTFPTSPNHRLYPVYDKNAVLTTDNDDENQFYTSLAFQMSVVRQGQIEDTAICSGDYVEIGEGHSPDGNLMWKKCGHTLPAAVTSKSNTFYILFHSGGSGRNSAFSVNVRSRQNNQKEYGARGFKVEILFSEDTSLNDITAKENLCNFWNNSAPVRLLDYRNTLVPTSNQKSAL
ncbi:hypothetical protein CLF_111331 [Clonorchis sinensis]|uniref:CUB domain-containing protein n=1 Tax=Clonorchis sinensis TaxID=79923 RepID=G7YUN2_CLOSI|nr:hypothetical protein CLF_111331 [Clonorchis sinensis]